MSHCNYSWVEAVGRTGAVGQVNFTHVCQGEKGHSYRAPHYCVCGVCLDGATVRWNPPRLYRLEDDDE